MRRINGPYQRGSKWRAVYADSDGNGTTLSFDTREEADAEIARLEARFRAEDTVRGLVDGLLLTAQRLVDMPTWIYLLHDADGRVLYVGETGSVRHRIRDHRDAGVQFAYVSWLPQMYERSFALEIERLLVQLLDPPLNEKYRSELETSRRARVANDDQ